MKAADFEHIYDPGDGNLPVFVTFHGTGGSPTDLIPFARSLVPGCGVLSGKGQVDEGGNARWFRRIAEGVLDIPDLRARTKDVAAWLEACRTEYLWQDRKVFAMGYSNGANILGNLLLQGHNFCDLAILLRSMVPDEPLAGLDLTGTKVLINSGTSDPLCPPEDGQKLQGWFKSAGADVHLHMINTGHGLIAEDFKILHPLVQKYFYSNLSDWTRLC